MYNGKVLKNQSLDSLNIGKRISFDAIIAKEKIALLPRTYVTIEDVKYVVADLKKRSCVVYASENKVSSYHGSIGNIHDYDEEIIFRVLKINSGIELVKMNLISLNNNDDNSKRARVNTNHYTYDYIKDDLKKHVSRRTLKRISEDTASHLMKSEKKRILRCPKERLF